MSRHAGQPPDQGGDQPNVRLLCTISNIRPHSSPPNSVIGVNLVTLSSEKVAEVGKAYPISDVFRMRCLRCNAAQHYSDEHDEPRRFPPTVGAPYLLLGQRRLTRPWRDELAQRHCGVAECRLSPARARCPRPRRDDPASQAATSQAPNRSATAIIVLW